MATAKKVVTIGGGGGQAAVVAALKDLPIELAALAAMVDDGGSTGRLRQERGVQAVGGIRQLLSAASVEATQALERRDPKGDPTGNLLLADLEQKTGSFQTAIDTLRQQFNVPYQIFPLTEVSPVLHAESQSGKVIDGQRNIVEYTWNHPQQSLVKLWITPADAQLSPGARTALRQADVIIIPMGDIYSSIAPAFCVRELIELWLRLSPQVVWLPNFTAAPGRNKYASASGALDFYHMLNPGFHPAKIIAHDGTLTEAETERIRQRKYTISPLDLGGPGTALIKIDLLDHAYAPPTANQVDIVERSPIRYDSLKLHNIFKEILG